MTSEDLLKNFGLPASISHRDDLRRLLTHEIAVERRGESGEEMLRTLCAQLFSLAVAEDALLIWEAKQSSFDAGCAIDVQLICGAGLIATKNFLSRSTAPAAADALEYLSTCEEAGNFDEWSPEKGLADHRHYYGLS